MAKAISRCFFMVFSFSFLLVLRDCSYGQGEASLSRVYATASGKTSFLGRIVLCGENEERQEYSRSLEREGRICWTYEEVLLKTLDQEQKRNG